MPPRITIPARIAQPSFLCRTYATVNYSPIASAAAAHAPTQPPSHRAADARKTQLHRTYLSLLRSTPLMLVFQHNNLKATEWTALRREIAVALRKLSGKGEVDPIADGIKVVVLRGAVFSSAMRVAEYYDANNGQQHGTSKEAYELTKRRTKHPLAPLFSGPVGIVTFSVFSPIHLKTVVELMFPEGRSIKGMDPAAVSGLQKLVLLAARVDGHVATDKLGSGRVLDGSMVRWASGLPGFEALRGQLVAMLQSVGGAELARALEAIPVSVVRTVDAHRKVLSGELGGEGEGEKKEDA
jgi:large subunit ribosomal protein L10